MDIINKNRCKWCTENPIYKEYHDKEWGVPVYNDKKIFECLMLETLQAGLSWITVLKKRENFRKAFSNFDYKKIAKYSDKKLEELTRDASIIRHKKKIISTKNNAINFLKIQKEFGSFSKYIWQFVDGKPIQNNFMFHSEIPTRTKLSKKISKDLKKRGFQFVGETMIYGYMQATGIVNDHTTNCFRHQKLFISNI